MTFLKKQEMVTFGQRHREHQNKLTPQLALGIIIKVMKRTEQRSPTTQILPTPNITFLTCFLFLYSNLKLTKKMKSWSMYLFCFLGHNFISLPSFSYKNFRHNKLFNKHPYIHLLVSTINIFLYLLFHISIHSPLYPCIGPFFFFDAFHSKFQPSVHFTPLTKFHIKLFSFHTRRSFDFQWLSCKQHVAEF